MGELPENQSVGKADQSLRWIVGAMGVGVLVAGGAIVYSLQIAQQSSPEASPSAVSSPGAIANQPVSALGRIAPLGEIFKLSAPPGSFGGARIHRILVREGDRVKEGQVIAVLDSYEQKLAAVITAQQGVKVAQSELNIIKAGAKPGEIAAQRAQVAKAQAQLQQEFAVNQAGLVNLIKQLEGEKLEQQATIDRLKAEVRQAEQDARRYRTLAEEGAIALAEWEQRRLTLETSKQRLTEAQARLMKTEATLTERIREQKFIQTKDAQTQLLERESARATLDKIQEVRPVDVNRAQAELDLAIARFNEAKAELNNTIVRAPVDAQVLKIHSRPGEKVDDGTGIADLGITSQMMVVAEVYENDISRVKVGQTAWITSENASFAGELEGRVSAVGLKIGKNDVLDADPASDVDARVVEVKILLSPQGSKAVAGLSNAKVLVKIDPS